MRKWEDIIKDRLEDYESPLPEGSLAKFQSLRDGALNTLPAKRRPLVWVTVAVVAAGLASVLFLRHPAVPENEVLLDRLPGAPAALAVDQSSVNEPLRETPPAHSLNRKTYIVRQSKQVVDSVIQAEEITAPPSAEEAKAPAHKQDSLAVSSFPFPDTPVSKQATINVVPAAGVLAGGGLLAAVVAPFLKDNPLTDDINIGKESDYYTQVGILGYDGLTPVPVDTSNMDEEPKTRNVLLGSPVHHLPVRFGLSARVPLDGRLYLTSGIEYSLYKSTFTYSLSGDIRQTVQYLGIPLRVDWSFASGNLMEAYVGGGVKSEICIGATFAGNRIKKDGASISVLGAGGIQMNLTRHLGLYVEPELSWLAIPGKSVLETYRSEHPVMFSATTGLRINIEKEL